MPVPRCPRCHVPVTEEETRGEVCPSCSAPLDASPPPAPPAASGAPRRTGRGWAFCLGLLLGAGVVAGSVALAGGTLWPPLTPVAAAQAGLPPAAAGEPAPDNADADLQAAAEQARADAESALAQLAAVEKTLQDARAQAGALQKAKLEAEAELAKARDAARAQPPTRDEAGPALAKAREQHHRELEAALARARSDHRSELDTARAAAERQFRAYEERLAAAERALAGERRKRAVPFAAGVGEGQGQAPPVAPNGETLAVLCVDRPDGEYALAPLDRGAVKVVGRVRTLKVKSVNNRSFLDCTDLKAREIVFVSPVGNESDVRIRAPGAKVKLADVSGRSKVDVSVGDGSVSARGISGDSQVTLAGKKVELTGSISGSRTQVTAVLTREGRLQFAALQGGRLHWRPEHPGDPPPAISKGAVSRSAEFRQID